MDSSFDAKEPGPKDPPNDTCGTLSALVKRAFDRIVTAVLFGWACLVQLLGRFWAWLVPGAPSESNESQECVDDAQRILFLRTSENVDPFSSSKGVIYRKMKGYGGVKLKKSDIKDRGIIAVYCLKTGDRLPLDINDESSSPTKTVKQCVKASSGSGTEVVLFVAGVAEDEASAMKDRIKGEWKSKASNIGMSLDAVNVFCYDQKLSEEQEKILFSRATSDLV